MVISTVSKRPALIVGGGPAGLFVAERLSAEGLPVVVVDRMPTFGRKLLMAGRGGLNLSHSEDFERLISRYGSASQHLRPQLEAFSPASMVAWAEGLGQSTFVGSSGRVFPTAMKASPLLRAWLARLASKGVTFVPGRRWLGWNDAHHPVFSQPHDMQLQDILKDIDPLVTVLALGGASWPRLGSDGRWCDVLRAAGVTVAPLLPSNAGVIVPWTQHMRRYAGQPLKRIAITIGDIRVQGEAVVTRNGLEGGVVYAANSAIRTALARGNTMIVLDLRPDLAVDVLAAHLAKPRGKQSQANHVRKATGLAPVAIALVREASGGSLDGAPISLAHRIKAAEISVAGFSGLDRAISSAGGVAWECLNESMMLRMLPGVFAAGEMVDWDAPTGGYLLQAAFATANRAADGALAWCSQNVT